MSAKRSPSPPVGPDTGSGVHSDVGRPAPLGLADLCDPQDPVTCLLAATQELNAADDLTSGLRRVAEIVARYVRYKSLGVLLLDELGRELRFAVAIGYPPEVVEHWRFGLGQGVIGTAAANGRPVRVDDVRTDPRYIDAGEKIVAELALPLVAKGRTVGVLTLGSEEAGAFSAAHERLLSFLAGHLASAIETAQLYQNTREQARTLSLLHEISRELNSLLDRRQLLERVGVAIRRLIDYDLFSVLLWNEQRRILEPWLSVAREDGATVELPSVALGVGLCGTAAALRQPLRVANVHVDPRYVRGAAGFDVRSELVVPLVYKDRLLGVLDLESLAYDAFTAQHEQLLATLAGALAVSLENARLYEQLQEEERRIREDLATARQIQRQLLPKTTPWVPGLQIGVAFEPARDLGGDFYDFLDTGDGAVAFAVGDVSGKATAAALYGSFAVGLLREHYAQLRPSPGRMLTGLNDKLRLLGIDNRFLAMIYAVYESVSKRLVLANSGLPLPYLVRGGVVTRLATVGTPLGLLAGRRYEELELRLEVGDVVVLATDGIEESHDAKGRELGGDRVATELAALAASGARDIAHAVLDLGRRHTGPAEASDDRTVLALKLLA